MVAPWCAVEVEFYVERFVVDVAVPKKEGREVEIEFHVTGHGIPEIGRK